jgi:acyl-CoA thioesterase
VGNLDADTAVEPIGEGRFRAGLSPDWGMWGPNGGYLATIALRAAGATATLAVPASLNCGFLGAPTFDEVTLEVTRLRGGRRAELLRVGMFQDGKQVVEATVRVVAEGLAGPERQWHPVPDAPWPTEVPTMAERTAATGGDPIPLWRNYEIRPVGDPGTGPDRAAGEPFGLAWLRFVPRADFPDDPWLDAGRCLIATDIVGFPSVVRGFASDEVRFVAPTLDLQVNFHAAGPGEWLLVEAEGLHTGGGLAGGRARIWSPDVGLVASGSQQMMITTPH